MKAGTFFVRTWRILSILGFLFALFNSYISYPGDVIVRFDEQNQPIQMVDREVIFYVAVAIFLINITMMKAISRLFLRLPTASIPIPNKAVWAVHRSQLNELFTNWFYALTAAVNTVLAFGLIALSLLNRSDRGINTYDYVWLLPISAIMLIGALVALPIRLLMKPSDND